MRTRKTTVERTVELSLEQVQKTETSRTQQDELSEAVKDDDKQDLKLAFTSTISQSWGTGWSPRATAADRTRRWRGRGLRRAAGALDRSSGGRDRGAVTILTTEPNRLVGEIHNRPRRGLGCGWTRTRMPADVADLLAPCTDEWLTVRPVSALINNVANEGPALVEPPAPEPERDVDQLELWVE